LYEISLYGALGLWKSTDGGVSWNNVWNGNVFLPDGTEISADVGGDVGNVEAVGPDHLVLVMHGDPHTPTNAGIFESTDGGGRWILHRTTQFMLGGHADIFRAWDERTWTVTAGILSGGVHMYRTTDAGETWNPVQGDMGRSTGHQVSVVDAMFYSATDG